MNAKHHYCLPGLDELQGLVPRVIGHLVDRIDNFEDKHIDYELKVSMIEIYLERIRDLIDTSRTNLHIREGKAFILSGSFPALKFCLRQIQRKEYGSVVQLKRL